MKYINKIFTIGLAGLSVSPTLASLNTGNVDKTIVLNTSRNEAEEKDLRCTIAYVGKNCTKDGLAIIARTNDSSPKASNSYLKKVKHNEIANTTIKNNYGFEYTFPSETYAYISSPDSIKTDEKATRNLWQNMGINEMGVGITCTLTCYTNEKAQYADPFLDSGIAEECFNQILAAQADSARKAMEVAASVIDKYGSEDANIIMATDQNETWLMEIYTGHEYAAVKLPDDKVMVAGNEFILNSLDELGINKSNAALNCILSPRLQSLAEDYGFATYTSTKPSEQDVYHLNLFYTYGGESPTTRFSDGCHMRTWRGYSLWDPSGDIAKSYGPQTKYPPLFTPKDANGNIRHDMTIYDVIDLYRDEYDNLIGKEGFELFTQRKADGSLRPIATESARLVHIMTSDPSLPKEIAVNALYCPSSANYTPFVLLNNGINEFNNDEYAYNPENWSYDEKNASVLFRKLNSLAWPHREKYGYPLQDFFAAQEYIYISEMQQVINDASKLSLDKAKEAITKFNDNIRNVYIDTVKYVTEDLTWHDMDQDHRSEAKIKEFVPLVDVKQYLSQLGWTDFNVNNKTLTFKYGDSNATLEFGDGYVYEKSKLTIDSNSYDVTCKFKDNKFYVGFKELNTAIGDKAKLITINVNDYIYNWLPLILSLSIGIPVLAAIAIAIPLIIRKKNRTNKHK